eukprot:GEZU01013836.1.p1 GENE.GEZU01013836.1~~GEZU01013836.1.p1  ORF type:complete len:695 (-),score=236.47 GEZU01013836.1:44-2128(-)
MGRSTTSWITQDNGGSYRAINVKSTIVKFEFHPTNPSWAICLQSIPKSSLFALYVTKDLGVTWTLVSPIVADGSWGSIKASAFNQDYIYLIQSDGTNYNFQIYNLGNSSAYTVLKGGKELAFLDNFLFVATVHDQSDTIALYSSVDNAKTLRKVEFPFNLEEKSYTILDTSEGTAFLNVYHEQYGHEPWGNVYSSDSSGSRYSLSLYRNHRYGFSCDFHKVESLEGIYIANIISNARDEECKFCRDEIDCERKCHTASRISFDKGGSWQAIARPEKDANGNPIVCPQLDEDEQCSLHLHGFASPGFSPLHSSGRAVGLILATGNVGPYLLGTVSADEANTYFSRDGGLKWEEIKKGSHIYEFANHGSIMALAKTKATTSLTYSYNEGLTWLESNFTSSKVTVRNIYTSPDQMSVSFILEVFTSQFQTNLIHVDFSNVLTQQCNKPDNPGDDDSDYQTFKPHSYSNGACLLGREIEYTRKIRERKCYNPVAVALPVTIKNCDCTYEDFECDFGFEVQEGAADGQLHCVPQEGTIVPTPPPSPCHGTYNVTRGYRKVAGDSCVGGLQYEPIPTKCPGHGISVIKVLGITLVCLILLSVITSVMVILGLMIAVRKSERMRALFNDRLPGFARYVQYTAAPQPTQFGLGDDDLEDDDDEQHVGGVGNANANANDDDDDDEEERGRRRRRWWCWCQRLV